MVKSLCNTLNLVYKISFLLSSKFRCYSSLSHSSFSPPLPLLIRVSLISEGLFILFYPKHMSHEMLHHIEPKYSLNCCTYLIWFEFELKTLEKINRKAIRNSLENRKPNLAQVGPLSPTQGAWQAGPAYRRQPACPLSPSLSLPRGPGHSAPSSRPRARFSLCPADPTCQLVSNLPHTIPRRGRTHVRAFSGHVLSFAPLLSHAPLLSPTPYSPTSPRSLALSAEPARPLSRSTRVTRELRHRPPSIAVHSTTAIEHASRLLPR
jgi:hypothetical protein